eukprot:m.980863 g.980863  ORF g.980863 m.980863 type:complete len:262 (+) comp23970_c0_seq3:290-1075(+)
MGRGVNGRAHKSRSQCKDGKSLHFGPGDKRTQMPVCKYGPACTRSDCIYRHPKGEVEKSSTVCMAYVAGVCSFGNKCTNRHPSADEIELLVAKYSKIQCRFGKECFNEACLYDHGDVDTEPTARDTAIDGSAGPDPRLAKVRAFLMQKKSMGIGREIAASDIPHASGPNERVSAAWPDDESGGYFSVMNARSDGEWSTGQNGSTAIPNKPGASPWGMMDGLTISGLPFRPTDNADNADNSDNAIVSNTTLSATATEFVPSW